jgi:Flp pilus assembly protein protease CpaA
MLLTLLILIWIALRDLWDHTITNVSLMALSFSLLYTFRGSVHLGLGAITFIFLIFASMLVGLGGGDIKLITALALFSEIYHPMTELLTLSTALIVAQLFLIWMKNRKIPDRIALAPSICIPMIFTMVLH